MLLLGFSSPDIPVRLMEFRISHGVEDCVTIDPRLA